MEIIVPALVILGVIIIFGKVILLFFSALGGFFSFLFPLAVLIALIFFFTLLF
tara:strand:+ start:102 stop:260 length:159 start_codon:yes stop_codon:yes gene_type:complete